MAEEQRSAGVMEEGSSKAQREAYRLRVLLTVFILLAVVFVALSLTSPEGSLWLSRWQAYRAAKARERQFLQALQKDPPLGVSVAELDASVLRRVVAPGQPTLVVVFDRCEGCGAQRLGEWAETLGSWATLRRAVKGVLVIQDAEGKVREVARERGWKVPVVADEEGKVRQVLNAFFSPRAYGFVGGKLVWVQKDPRMGVVGVLREFLRVAEGEKEAARLLSAWAAEMREKAWGKAAADAVSGREEP